MIVYERNNSEYAPPAHIDLEGAVCFHCGRPFNPNARAVVWFGRSSDQTRNGVRVAMHLKCAYTVASGIMNELPRAAFGSTPTQFSN